MPYILVDASGWVVSDVSFGFMGGFRSCNIRPPITQMTQLALILLQLPSRQLTCASTQGEKNDHRKGYIYNFATANQS